MLKLIKSLFKRRYVPEREEIPVEKMGLCFQVNEGFGNPKYQVVEVRGNLGIEYIRINCAWTDAIQPTEASPIDWTALDEFINNIHPEIKVLVTLYGMPIWATEKLMLQTTRMEDVGEIFAAGWCKPFAERYKNNKQIIGYQVLAQMEIKFNDQKPAWYIHFVRSCRDAIKNIDANKLIVNAITPTMLDDAILNYNKTLISLGLLNYIDVYAVTCHTNDYDKMLRKNGMIDFLNTLNKPVWITELGTSDWEHQLDHAERMIPFLFKNVKQLQRAFWFQFTSIYPDVTGLKIAVDTVYRSDLYNKLRSKYLD